MTTTTTLTTTTKSGPNDVPKTTLTAHPMWNVNDKENCRNEKTEIRVRNLRSVSGGKTTTRQMTKDVSQIGIGRGTNGGRRNDEDGRNRVHRDVKMCSNAEASRPRRRNIDRNNVNIVMTIIRDVIETEQVTTQDAGLIEREDLGRHGARRRRTSTKNQ